MVLFHGLKCKTNALMGMAMLCSAFLMGCDVSTPSQLNVRHIQLREAVKTETLDALHLDTSRVNIIADAYVRNGRGPLSLTLSSLAGSAQQASDARKQGARYKEAFASYGVPDLKISYVTIEDPAYAGLAVVAYKSLVASPPKECGRIPGYQGSDTLQNMDQYDIGCETQSVMSRMIADPSDLMGKAGTPNEDSRRQGAAVEKYKSGKPNDKLNGLSASTIGGGGG
jgi:pilus biogenesis lipoprotein CpaD